MAKKEPPLSDGDILTRVSAKSKESVGWYDSKLSAERTRVKKYYNGELPKRQHLGSSSYVSTDVYDSLESMKSQLLETFAANTEDLVAFPPMGADDVESSRIATEATSYEIFHRNDGYDVFSHAMHDGLDSRVGVTKVFWEKIETHVEETFDNIPMQDAYALTAQEDIVDLEAEAQDPEETIYSGKLKRKRDESKVTLLPVPPEEFLISPRARNLADADFVSHRTLKTKAELKAMGFDAAKVDAINADGEQSTDLLGTESIERNTAIAGLTTDEAIQPELQKVWLFESYVKMDMRDGNGACLYKIVHVDNALFSKDEVDRHPFMVFTPLPIPHVFFGNNFALKVVPTQNARTVLTRGVLDHTSITVNPRWGVLQGGLLNPKEMLENRLGGIVNMKRPDAVKALEYANLNPFVFQVLEMLKANKEESTGISALSQGLNKDAISSQNSTALVDNLVSLSQQRQKIIARNFAFGYLIPLYLEVYRLILENADKEKDRIIEVAGNWVPVSIKQWKERTTCKASLHLGYGDRDRETAKYANVYGMLSKDPGIAPMFTPENRYNLICDGLKSAGFKDHSRYLTAPDKVQPPQPDPLKVKELEIKDKTATAALTSAQATVMKTTRQAEQVAEKQAVDELKAHSDTVFKAREADRQDADVANRIDVAQREIKLAEEAPQETENVIVSPNG